MCGTAIEGKVQLLWLLIKSKLRAITFKSFKRQQSVGSRIVQAWSLRLDLLMRKASGYNLGSWGAPGMWEYIKPTCHVTASPPMLKPPATSRLPKTPEVTCCHKNSTVTCQSCLCLKRTLSLQAVPWDLYARPRDLQDAEEPWCHWHFQSFIADIPGLFTLLKTWDGTAPGHHFRNRGKAVRKARFHSKVTIGQGSLPNFSLLLAQCIKHRQEKQQTKTQSQLNR